LAELARATRRPGKSGTWTVEGDLRTVAAWQPEVGPADLPARRNDTAAVEAMGF